MKVLVVTNMYPTEKMPFYGIFVKEQVESLRREGLYVDVFFINGKENRLNYFTCIITLIKTLKSINYDIIHAHHTYCIYPIMIAKAVLRMNNYLVLTFHEGEVHERNALRTRNVDLIKRLAFSKNIKKFALKMASLVIAVEKGLIEEVNFKGKYRVLACGVDIDLFKPMDKITCRNKLNIPPGKKVIFFPAAANDNNKGFDMLIEALKYINREDIWVLTAGNIHHQDVPYYMCAADVVVQLSIFEASPMVLKEAMAVNVPVVFTDVGDARLTMKNAKGCFLCKRTPQDVALRLKDALECDGSCEGRLRIIEEGLGLSEVAKKVIKIYKGVLA